MSNMNNFKSLNIRNSVLQGVVFTILVVLSSCSPKLQLARSEKGLYPISSDLPKDRAITDYYLPYKLRLDSMMNEVVAVSAVEISKARPEGPLNNLMADAMAYAGKSRNIQFDIAYTNYGGLRIPLPKGNIPLYKVFELMPFENSITTVRFNGADMKAFFDYMAAGGGDPISGATFKISNKKATDIKINGKPLDMNSTYTVLTSDYMANGGDGGAIFLKATDRMEFDLKLRDALLMYLRNQHKSGITLNPGKDGRVILE